MAVANESERTDPRLVLKSTPPKASKAVLLRARLGLSSPSLADKTVIAIQASPGFGKTALLTQWRREALASGAAVAWLSLDAQDESSRFTDGLMLTMRAGTRKAMQDHEFRDANAASAPFGRIASWLSQIAEFAGEVLLILDDVHTLPAGSRDALAYVLHNTPANLKVVLASRKPLPFPVIELMTKGQYASLETDDLRLRLPETTELLHTRFGSRVDADNCARLHQLTEGWALGLQLVMGSLDKHPNFRDAVASCLSQAGDGYRFFVDALLQRLEKTDMDFLVVVSFVDALHPELCQAITGLPESAAILARLCEQTPILSEAIGTPWLRIHALAKDALSEMFARLAEADQQQHRAAAASWLADHGFYEEAARHALRTGQETLAVDLAERSLYEIYRSGQVSRITQWLDRFSPEQLQHRTRLRIALGWALAKIERNAEAIALVRPIIEDPMVAPADRYEGVLIVANAALYRDQVDEAKDTLAAWRERLTVSSPVQLLVSRILEAFFALHQGAPEQARYLLTSSATDDSQAGRYATGGRDWVVAMSYLWQGQVQAAEAGLRSALAEVEPIAGRRSPIASMLAATLAMVLWEKDEAAEVDGLLADRRDVIDLYAFPDVIAISYVVAARRALQTESLGAAYALLERLYAIGMHRRLYRLCVSSLVEQLRLATLQGRERSCDVIAVRLLEALQLGEQAGWGGLQDWIAIQAGIAHAYVHMAHQDWPKAKQALVNIQPLAEKLRRNRDLLQIHLLLALAEKHSGQESEPMFREVLFITESLGLKRILVDTHPELVDWDQRLRTSGGRLVRPINVIDETDRDTAHPFHRSGYGSGESVTVSPSLLLTPKERDVIGLLAKNLSNKEIASALDLSIQTVKWHMKNLFAKLQAGSRKHLLNRARQLGILQ